MTTIINMSRPVKHLPEMVSNWQELGEEIQQELLNCLDFKILIPELLIYTQSKAMYSCGYTFDEDLKTVEIESIYNRNRQQLF